MNLANITVTCFAASYGVALVLEAASLLKQTPWRRGLMLAFTAAGIFAHVAYLGLRAGAQASPLSSPAEWCLIAALVLAAVSLAATLMAPRAATGLFLLPVVLGLIGFSLGASDRPFAPNRAYDLWAQVHGWLLLLATVTVCLGFLAGLMYLVQSWRLKHKLLPTREFRLPSLETLQRINAHALGASAMLVAGGFGSGLVLQRLKQGAVDWRSPVTLSLAAMLVWLLAAEAFRIVYPAARRGRKVAYLTLASFGFLLIAIASVTLIESAHGGSRDDARPPAAEPQADGQAAEGATP
ncbi:Cytochrome C assembly protein [Pirellulimonas nuda]|uniref:Cytochrome C assembly protein n=1 Tax=Pirellulimonas nuda TaxID=2528009 RepID=A0A518D7D8_9BACT|nr:cytochrome C assembly protein [Pirellulimonas nuda]QDU87359.1 Cytochrome C assembly protein [Pirellulimonas nuda]